MESENMLLEESRSRNKRVMDEEERRFLQPSTQEVTGNVKTQNDTEDFNKKNTLVPGTDTLHPTFKKEEKEEKEEGICEDPTHNGHFAYDSKFSPTRDSLIGVAYVIPSIPCADPSVPGFSLLSKGVAYVDTVHHPSQSQFHRMLLCEAKPTCCNLSPQNAYLAFAGNMDGSEVLWDLQEPEFMHKSPLAGCPSLVPTVATFTTADLSTPENHSSPNCTIAPLTMGTRDPSHTASTSAMTDYLDKEKKEEGEVEVEEVEEASGGEEERTVPAQPRALEQSTNRLNMAEIAMAISAENQAVETRQANLVSLGQEAEPKRDDLLESDSIPNLQPSPSRAHVQFSGASKREQQQRVSKRTSTRGQELLELIELDIVSFDLFELQPLSEYELYIKNFGMENTRQVIVQTGEDNMDRDIQTDAVTCSERWVQWPPEDFRGCGGPSDEESSEAARTINIGEGAVRLLSFLKKAGQVCSELLEENLIGCDESISSISHSQLPFCTDLICFPTLSSSFEGHFACDVKFSPIRDNLIAVAYSTPSITCVDSTVSGSSLLSRGVVCVWDTHHPSQPHQMLLCEATPTCCCFSPQKTYLVFAGNVDGSVVLWDLREPEFMHKSPLVGYPSLVPRVATFTTACLSTPDNHSSPICTIAPLTMGTRDPSHTASTSAIEDDSSGLSFQLATLDQSGRLNLWVVVEIYHPDPHGSESDLGLVPGGKVKLVKNVTIETCAPNGKTLSAAMAERVLCMQFSPLDANHLYVGMDTGSVHHFTRYGRRPIPKQYHSGQAEGLVYDITSISFCPQQPDHFLAAGSDGSIRLHCIAREYPLLYWPHSTGGNSVVSVQWSPSKPGLFVVLDENSIIYIWDLVQCDASPISSHQMKSSVITCQMPHCNETSRAPSLLLALADGSMELHYLKDSFCPKDSDMNQFNLYLDSLSSS